MAPCELLCKELAKSVKLGQNNANQVIQEFGNYLMRKNKFLVQKLLLKLRQNSQEDPIIVLRTNFLNDKSVPLSCTNKFYEILKKHNYLEETEVIECMSSITNTKKFEEEKAFWKRCPWIKDIIYDEKTKMFTIITTKDTFSFFSCSAMFKDEVAKIKKIIPNVDYSCHDVTCEFIKEHPEYYATTCICPNAFLSSYWLHSYNVSYNKEFVVDIANNIVMSSIEFNKLIKPVILDETKGEEVFKTIKKILCDENWPFKSILKTSPLKAVAFYSYDQLSQEEQQVFLKH